MFSRCLVGVKYSGTAVRCGMICSGYVVWCGVVWQYTVRWITRSGWVHYGLVTVTVTVNAAGTGDDGTVKVMLTVPIAVTIGAALLMVREDLFGYVYTFMYDLVQKYRPRYVVDHTFPIRSVQYGLLTLTVTVTVTVTLTVTVTMTVTAMLTIAYP